MEKNDEISKILEKNLEIERKNFDILVQNIAPQQFEIAKLLFNILNLIIAANISAFIYLFSNNFFENRYISLVNMFILFSFFFASNGIRFAIKYMTLEGFRSFFVLNILNEDYVDCLKDLLEKNDQNIEEIKISTEERAKIIRNIKDNVKFSLIFLMFFFLSCFAIMMKSKLDQGYCMSENKNEKKQELKNWLEERKKRGEVIKVQMEDAQSKKVTVTLDELEMLLERTSKKTD